MTETRGVMRAALVTAGLLLPVHALWAQSSPLVSNRLSPDEQKAGWRLLFDGKTTSGWRGFQTTGFPRERWVVEDGSLRVANAARGASHGGADIITDDSFGDFDLRWEWRIAPGGNSGVKYLVTEERKGPIAHEYQILDDDRNPDAKVGPHRQAAALYDVLPSAKDKSLRPVGDWNESRVLLKGNHVEHWLNGRRVLEYELGSPELQAAIARSKFKDVPGFGTKIQGHILLQDHGDEVWFRNVKILSPPS